MFAPSCGRSALSPHYRTSWVISCFPAPCVDESGSPRSLSHSFSGVSTVSLLQSEMANINPQMTRQHALSAQWSTFQIQDKQPMFCCTFRWLTQMCSGCRFCTLLHLEMVSFYTHIYRYGALCREHTGGPTNRTSTESRGSA